jgi:hypothetical protein
MEADWEVEVGGGAAVIEALWAGFVDLRREPERIGEIAEAAAFPALVETLVRLNSDASAVWTSKCDFWPVLEPDAFDRDELDAPAGCAAHAMGCYIDLLPKSGRQWTYPARAVTACRQMCILLGAVPLRCCRVDLVVRRALATPDLMGLGITAYLTACGESEAEAARTLWAALTAFADVLCGHWTVE